MITLEGVSKRFGAGTPAVDNLSLHVESGEVCVVIGPSGCGKSTTLRMINRLIEPSSGTITIDGRDVATVDPVSLRRGIGYVIQHVGLLPHRTVADNVATVPHLLGWDRRRVRARVEELLDLVGLAPEEYGPRRPHELSGGQRQRVGVARALGADPPVLLMDEPFGAIDPITRQRLQTEFVLLQRRLRKTVVFVTHDLDEAVRLVDRIALLAQGGRLAQFATPAELLGHPASAFVEEFVGADRALRRLAVVPLDRSSVARGGAGAPPGPSVQVGASLREALVAVLGSPSGRAVVRDGDAAIGTVDAGAILAAAHSGGDGPVEAGGRPS